MQLRLRRWVFRVAIWTIAIFGIGLLVQQSKAFTNCIHDRKNSKEYKSLHERGITSRNPRQTRPARSRDPRAEAVPKERRNANLNAATFDRQGVLWFTGWNGIYGRRTAHP